MLLSVFDWTSKENMKLSQIVNNIKLRFQSIKQNPKNYFLDFGDFQVYIDSFSYDLDQVDCNFCGYPVCDYVKSSATICVKGITTTEVLEHMKSFAYGETGDYLRTIVVEPTGTILEGAFIRDFSVRYLNDLDKTMKFDMTIIANNIIERI